MRVSPIKRYDGPSLPTHAILDEHPELLRLVPKRWQGNPVVLSALAAVAVLMLGHRAGAESKSNAAATPRVAPIFQHGDGRGAFGCKAINPPVFLSEDEARQVIIEEARRAGLDLAPNGPTLSQVLMPELVTAADGKRQRRMTPLKTDGSNGKHEIVFEFVSLADASMWQFPPRSTAYAIDTLGQATRLRDRVAKSAPPANYAVFYDPLVRASEVRNAEGQTDWQATREKRDTEAREQDKEDLRKQVQDFVKWLKAQGVI